MASITKFFTHQVIVRLSIAIISFIAQPVWLEAFSVLFWIWNENENTLWELATFKKLLTMVVATSRTGMIKINSYLIRNLKCKKMPHCSRQDDTKMRFVWSNAHFVCCLISTRVIELAEIVPLFCSFKKFEFHQNCPLKLRFSNFVAFSECLNFTDQKLYSSKF